MSPFNRIIFATDFSLSSMSAARTARDLAHAFDAKLTLLFAFDPDHGTKQEALEYLEVLLEERFDNNPDVTLVAAAHQRADVAICGEAVASKADLIVAGRHGKHRLSQRLLGSVTERVVRSAPCSVWVAHPASREPAVLTKHIVAPTDLSDQGEPAIAAASAVARSFNSWVSLVHVYDVLPPLNLLQRDVEDDEPRSFGPRIEHEMERLRTKYLDDVPSDATLLRDKNTVTAICDFASDKKADLLVTGTHGRTGVSRLLIGSVAERVIRHAPCSVLVCR